MQPEKFLHIMYKPTGAVVGKQQSHLVGARKVPGRMISGAMQNLNALGFPARTMKKKLL